MINPTLDIPATNAQGRRINTYVSLALCVAILSTSAFSEPVTFYGDGIHDDSFALEALAKGQDVKVEGDPSGVVVDPSKKHVIIVLSEILLCRPINLSDFDIAFVGDNISINTEATYDISKTEIVTDDYRNNYYLGITPKEFSRFIASDLCVSESGPCVADTRVFYNKTKCQEPQS